MTKEFLQETNWESEYKRDNLSKLDKRQIEILDGADLKSNEGMTFGQMYSDWKTQNGHD